MQQRITDETRNALKDLSDKSGYEIQETLSGSGDLGQFWLMRLRNTIWI